MRPLTGITAPSLAGRPASRCVPENLSFLLRVRILGHSSTSPVTRHPRPALWRAASAPPTRRSCLQSIQETPLGPFLTNEVPNLAHFCPADRLRSHLPVS